VTFISGVDKIQVFIMIEIGFRRGFSEDDLVNCEVMEYSLEILMRRHLLRGGEI